jgi:hypothetical protein
MNIIRAGFVGASLVLLPVHPSFADDAVDLRGKAGIVKDLKQYNPPEGSLHYKEPPSPFIPRQVDPPHSTPAPGYVNPTNGGLPPGGGAAGAVLAQPRPVR